MLQADIGAARCNDAGTYPVKGLRLRDYEFFNTDGKSIQVSDFRGKANLLLLFLGGPTGDTLEFAHEVEKHATEFTARESQVLIVFTATAKHLTSVRSASPIMVVADMDGSAHRQFGAMDASGHPQQACYVTDRFGEVFAAFRARDGHVIPTVKGMLEWLDFIEAQCPECEAPEWPADAA